MIIYHGSKDVIMQPEYGKGKKRNDYGRGFYCTEYLSLAKEWAVEEDRDGYANKYELNLDGLSVLDLSKDYSVLHWITILLQNRVFNLKHDVAKQGKRFLISNYSIPVDRYDIVRGYRADDSYFAFADSFLNNTISVQRLAEALHLGNLGEQIVLISPKTFQNIRFVGYELADAKTYYPLRFKRNEKARIEFLSDRKGIHGPDDLYLIDLMRGAKYDGPRIQ